MSIKKGASSVYQRILLIVALHQDGVETCDAPGRESSGSFNEPRHHGQYRRRITFGGRRFAGSETNLTLRHGEAGQRIKHQEDMLASGREILGNRRRR